MPEVMIQSPVGLCWKICTRQVETLLLAWFDEILPHAYAIFPDGQVLWPSISVFPMFASSAPGKQPSDPDWLCDSRVIGNWHEFRATNGPEGLKELLALRGRLEKEIRDLKR